MRGRDLLVAWLVGACVLATAAAHAQAVPLEPARIQPAPDEPLPAAALRVGDATSQLLALQRSGNAASPVERPIAGDVASRSYQRYLKSFDYPIPERYGTTVGGASSGNASSGGAR